MNVENGDRGTARSAGLEIHLFGAPRIIVRGELLSELVSTKAQALLFYLAVTRRGHTRAALAALLWADMPEAAARGNLRKALHGLRRHLAAYLLIGPDVVSLAQDAAVWVDVTELEALLEETSPTEAPDRLQRAIDLHRGDLLEGFYARNAPEFENWWLTERARLRDLMLRALQTLADHRAGQGNLDGAILLARRSIDLEPWHEEAHRRLMTWLALSGQRSAALAQFEVCRRVLDDELGVEPAQETVALYDRIRAGQLQAGTPFPAQHLAGKPQPPAFLSRDAEVAAGSRQRFVGRERQLERLEGFLEAALAGQGQMAFISGEAGWGKTRLLAEFSRLAQEAHPELLVAHGLCTTFTETGDPYLPFREILRMLSADVEQEWAVGHVTRRHALKLWDFLPRVVEALSTQGRHLIDTFVPGEALLQRAASHGSIDQGLLTRLQEVIMRRQAGHQDAAIHQERIFEEVGDLLQALSQHRPLLLILDDLHWADASSLGLLFHLGRRLADGHVLLVGTYRPEDIALGREGEEHPLANILSELKRIFGDVWVNLGEDEGEERTFVDALLDSEPNRLGEGFRKKLARTTKGHPLFTVEMLRDMQDHGALYQDDTGRWVESTAMTWDTLPGRVEGVIGRRVNRLVPALRGALVTASVEGEEFTAEVLARVRGLDAADMLRALSGDLARAHRLVQASGVELVGERRIAHYRFSHSLFQKYLYDTLDPVERVYLHDAIGSALEAVYQGHTERIAVRLASHFQAAGRFEKAVQYLQQAGDTAARVYANAEAIAHYSQAIELAGQVETDAQTLTQLYTRLGRALELSSKFDQVLATYEAMERLARERGDRRMELTSLMARATIQSVPTAVHDPERARVLGQQALSLAGELGDRAAEAEILWSLSVANYFTQRLSQAIDCGERSLALARELGLREQTAHTLNDLGGFIYLYSGRIDQAIQALEEAGELWRALDNTAMLVDSLGGSCIAHLFAGEFERAVALSEQAFQISRFIENLWGESYSRWTIGDAFRACGEYSRAIEVSEECIRLGELAGFLAAQTYTRLTLATIYGDLGALEQAWELTNAAQAVADRHGFRVHSARVLGVRAHLHVLAGELGQAEVAIGEARNEAFDESWAVLYLDVLRAEAELALRRADHRRALAVTEDLLGRLRRYGMRLGLPEALYWQGKALLGLGDEAAARDRFREARAEAEKMGSQRTLWRVLVALSEIEQDPSESGSLRSRAREIVSAIAGHVDEAPLRASFLNLPDVRALLESAKANSVRAEPQGSPGNAREALA